jgi:hypothetical protein
VSTPQCHRDAEAPPHLVQTSAHVRSLGPFSICICPLGIGQEHSLLTNRHERRDCHRHLTPPGLCPAEGVRQKGLFISYKVWVSPPLKSRLFVFKTLIDSIHLGKKLEREITLVTQRRDVCLQDPLPHKPLDTRSPLTNSSAPCAHHGKRG